MILKLGMQYLGLKACKVYKNNDTGLTLTYFTTRSNLVSCVLGLEKNVSHLMGNLQQMTKLTEDL